MGVEGCSTQVFYQRITIVAIILVNISFAGCCPDLFPPTNGIISGRCKEAIPGDYCTYNCASGFTLMGDPMLTCLSSQTWDKPPPACTKLNVNSYATLFCPNLKSPSNGFITGRCGGPNSKTGDLCTFYCNSGYYLIGNKQLICESHGRWSSDAPGCSIFNQRSDYNQESPAPENTLRCPEIQMPDGVEFLKTGDQNAVGTIIYFSCLPGRQLEGKASVRCESTGFWSGQAPRCRLIASCTELGPPQFGVVFGKVQTPKEGDIIFFSCDIGYKLAGRPSLKCQDDGHWDGPSPKCESETPTVTSTKEFPDKVEKHVILENDSKIPLSVTVEAKNWLNVRD